ncbi:FIST signal transduction protein [Flavobacterium sp.]|uniref:FIST signal transduction protein n=1 Tax=Flavobacterium sp. TaxID=239 RepID=UPI0025FBE4B3|nr:FIST N-terminal domain-containing protein [Flavobacterium sp.]
MLQFYSASTRIVNTKRGVAECLEIACQSDYENVDLLIFHASIGHDFDAILAESKRLAPNADVVAASCCGVVGREGVSESMKDIAMMAIKGKDYALASTDGLYGYNSYEKALELAQNLASQKQGINMIYFLGSGIDINNDLCIRAFEEVFGSEVTIFGATSSDNMKGYVSYQAINDVVYEHGAFAIGFCDPTLTVDTQATHGFIAIGEPMVVTKSEGHIIKELNGRPAWTEYLNRLGLTDKSDCGNTIPIGALAEQLSPELAKEYGNNHILRVVTKHVGEEMYYATTCPEGTELWLTVRDEEVIFNEMERIVECINTRNNGKKPVAVFHADCLARGRFLTDRILKEELVFKMQAPFYAENGCPPWLGMYGFGEFARLGNKNTYHNYTTALYVIYR